MIKDTNIVFEEDNFCEKDLQIVCQGDCAACPNREYFRIWDMIKPDAGSRPDFIIVSVTKGEK